jgi:outer membrane protein TolC
MNEDSPLDFNQAQQLYRRLQQRLSAGEITPVEMQQALAGLRVTDEQ